MLQNKSGKQYAYFAGTMNDQNFPRIEKCTWVIKFQTAMESKCNIKNGLTDQKHVLFLVSIVMQEIAALKPKLHKGEMLEMCS
jgi:hypothetical protein